MNSCIEIWNREYQQTQSIPSSTRPLPSKALLLFGQLLDFAQIRNVLDSGCGNGRNAIYLAEKRCNVTAADISPAALAVVSAKAEAQAMIDRISTIETDLLGTLPFGDGHFDLCLDSYVSCHFTAPNDFARYWAELVRVTRPRGYIFSSVFSADDEYYNSIAVTNPSSAPLVTDPTNGITKRLYVEDEFKSVLPPGLMPLFKTTPRFVVR